MNTLKQILKVVGDWFLNFNGDGDVKLFLGIAFAIFGAVYIAVINKGDAVGFGAIEGTAATFLGLALGQDAVNNNAPKTPPTP